MHFASPAALFLYVFLSLCSLTAHSTELTGWVREDKEYPQHQGMVYFFERLQLHSASKLTGKVLCCEELGKQNMVKPKFKDGEVDVVLFYSSALEKDLPEMSVLHLPFLFRSPEHMMAALNGDVGKDLQDMLEAKGYIALSWFDGGSRSFYGRKSLSYASDFRNMKIRVPKRDNLLSMVSALGGTSSTLAYDKVATALQSGELNVAENDLTSYYTSGHYKVAPYYTFSYHSVQPAVMLISTQRWAKLSETERGIVRRAATEASTFAAKLRNKQDDELRAKLEKAGVKFFPFRSSSTAISLMKDTYEPIVVSPKATSLMVKIMTSTHKSDN